MSFNKLSFSRSHVLGTYYKQCDGLDAIPVFLETQPDDPVGYVDESLGPYADAVTFHLPPDICKELLGGQFRFSFSFARSRHDKGSKPRRMSVTSVHLTRISKPLERRAGTGKKESAAMGSGSFDQGTFNKDQEK